MAEVNETSPLLAVEHSDAESSNSRENITTFSEPAAHRPARDFFPRPIKFLTWSIIISSTIGFIVLVASDILIIQGPLNPFYSYPNQDIETTLLFVGIRISASGYFFNVMQVFFAFVFAAINLRRKVWIIFNLFLDAFFSFFILGWSSALFGYGYPNSDWCETRRWDPVSPDEPTVRAGCLPWVLAAKILIGIGGGLVILAGYVCS
jgi:hypothetical protein